MTEALQSVGADIIEHADGWTINGPTPLRGGTQDDPVVIATHDDHRIAMSMAVAALVTDGDVALDNDACVAISFPNFFVTLEAMIGID